MYNLKAKRVANKWIKQEVLRKDPQIAAHIPVTRHLTNDQLDYMLKHYGRIILKPIVGTGGGGIISVTKLSDGLLVQFKQKRRHFSTLQAALSYIRSIQRKRQYMIQRAIMMATIQGRPIDYRVKIQKPKNEWIITGMVGRLARPGLFVTNLCKGGTRLTLKQGITRSLPHVNYALKRKEMRQLTRRSTQLLERHFPGIRQLGFDYGLDSAGYIWIFEVNTKPA
ncbi:YheC/YheD family protein [Rubeoparvulum massiliense]|uniref:YheC/YheD family protein n=1 Tax=Rubeoparvulum massiliense TaxID=1631346 RepID=UPI00065E43FE|nr:YheC/YheD family protein [Rubeoparvulum massiliense]